MMRGWHALWDSGIVAAALLVAGCALPKPPQVANPKYQGSDLKGRVLLVAPLDLVQVANLDDFKDDWSEKGQVPEPTPSLSRQYAEAVASLVDHAVVVADSGRGFGEQDFASVTLDVPGKGGPQPQTFRYPSGDELRKRGSEPDLVLQAFDLHFQRSTKVVGRRVDGAEIRMSYLDLTGNYIVWDYRAGAPVAYGRLTAGSPFNFAMTRDNWNDCLDQAAKVLVKTSAFKGRKYQKAVTPKTPTL